MIPGYMDGECIVNDVQKVTWNYKQKKKIVSNAKVFSGFEMGT